MPRPHTDDDDDEPDDYGHDDDDEPAVPCPYCRRSIPEDVPRCPYCEQYISAEDAPSAPKPWWLILGAVLCAFIIYRWVVG